jgi:hypothetical protein
VVLGPMSVVGEDLVTAGPSNEFYQLTCIAMSDKVELYAVSSGAFPIISECLRFGREAALGEKV